MKFLHQASILLPLTVIFSCFNVTAAKAAAICKVATRDQSSLTVYLKPNGEVTNSLKYGRKVEIDETKRDSEGMTWAKISGQYENFFRHWGWVRQDHLDCSGQSNINSANMVKQMGSVRAEVRFDKDENSLARNVRIKILRNEKVIIDEAISPVEATYSLSLSVRDLDGDEEPEAIFSHNPAHGVRCCSTSRIYGYKKSQKKYEMVNADWRSMGPPQIKDLDGNGKYEFDHSDWRFLNVFTSFANIDFPTRIWEYRQGQLTEVTYKYPESIRLSIKEHQKKRKHLMQEGRDLKGTLAAYAAAKFLVGEGEEALQEIQDIYKGEDKQEFLDKLNKFLKSTGYTSIPSK
jgi:hypothetical protein